MEYNSQRNKLIIPEYGRNVQKMVNYTVSIEDREKRNKASLAIFNIMSQINPGIKESTDYQRTLWDHMYIISKFRLDIDSPFPPPSQEDLTRKPEKVEYATGNIRFRHYGKNIQGIIDKAIAFEEGPEKEALIQTIGNHLKKSYLNWNRESVADETIESHLSKLSNENLELSEEHKLASTSDILARNKPKKKKFQQRGKDGNGKRKGYQHKQY